MPLVRKPPGPPAAAPGARTEALDALQSPDPDQRWAAARAAAGSPGAAGRVAAALAHESDARVREAMFTALGMMATPESALALLPLLRSDDAALRTGALDALRMMARTTRELLPSLLADPDVDVRILSCELARALPGEDATALLGDLLATEADVNVCAAAIDVLAEVGGPQAVPALVACARRFSGSSFLEFAAAIAIERLESRPANPRA